MKDNIRFADDTICKREILPGNLRSINLRNSASYKYHMNHCFLFCNFDKDLQVVWVAKQEKARWGIEERYCYHGIGYFYQPLYFEGKLIIISKSISLTLLAYIQTDTEHNLILLCPFLCTRLLLSCNRQINQGKNWPNIGHIYYLSRDHILESCFYPLN